MANILLVSARLESLGGLVEQFRKEGFSVNTATTMDMALARLTDMLPCVILCDVAVATIDGYRLLEVVRGQSTTMAISFIFLAATLVEAERRQAMNLGADDYFVFPCEVRCLIERIHCCLTRQRAFIQREVQRLEELRRNLTIAMPHELRTPLQGIITSAELLNEYWATLEQDDIGDITQNIMHSASRLNQLIQKFLDYFKLDLVAGDLEQCQQWQRQGVTSTSQLLIRISGEKLAKKYHRSSDFSCELCEAAIAISQKWLAALVEELLDNAFKFSQPDVLAPLPSSPLAVEVHSQISGDRWTLAVQDYGCGMTATEIEAVGAYMQFNRTQYEQQGTGLGLAIAERIVKIYNGTMVIDSTPNLGTLVTISFPLQNHIDVADLSIIG